MPEFESQFIASRGKPIGWNGHTLYLMDRFPVAHQDNIVVSFESVNSEWKQGLKLSTQGSFEVAGQKIPDMIVLWYHTAPSDVIIFIETRENDIQISNIWDTGDGVMHSWHNGAAMIVKQISPCARRYRCNDGHPDDNFDDIVFVVENEQNC